MKSVGLVSDEIPPGRPCQGTVGQSLACPRTATWHCTLRVYLEGVAQRPETDRTYNACDAHLYPLAQLLHQQVQSSTAMRESIGVVKAH